MIAKITSGAEISKYGLALPCDVRVLSIIRPTHKLPRTTKAKTKKPVPAEPDVTLEELRQMSEFFHQEQQNRRQHSEPKAKVFQKTDTNNNQ